MPKYFVRRTVHYTYECEAASEEAALEQASKLSEEEFDVADEDEMTVELVDDESDL